MATKTKAGLVKWDERLATLAKQTKDMESTAAAGGNFLGTKGGILTYQSNPVPGNTLDVVIIDHILENKYYGPEDFDPENPQPPICFALGRDGKTMAPHADSVDKQHPTCEGCPQNEWASAKRGKGKACKNTRRLALITEGDMAKDPIAAQTAYLNPPVTSVKAFAGYVDNLADTLNRPPLAVVTTIKLVPDTKNQFAAQFSLKSKIEDPEAFEGLLAKNELEKKAIMFPYTPPSEETAAPADNKKKKFAKSGSRK